MEKTTHKFKLYKTFRKDAFDDVVDLELGIWMYIYLNDENIIYLGKLIYYENITEDNHRYIQLSNYSCYSYYGEKIFNYVDDNCRTVLLNIKDVKRMELVYDDNNTKIKSSRYGSLLYTKPKGNYYEYNVEEFVTLCRIKNT